MLSVLYFFLTFQTLGERLEGAFRTLREAVEKDEIPGAIALVAKSGNVLRHEAIGLSDIENKIPFRTDTLCWMASITKPVTASAVMTLVDAGRVRLDDPVEKHLTEFIGQKDKEGGHHAFTIRQVLAHTAGLPTNPPTRKRDGRGPGGAVDDSWLSQALPDIVRSISEVPLESSPGSRFQYSNSGFFVLGRLIEVISGRTYAGYVREKILDPLRMKESTFSPTEPRLVSAIYRELQGKRLLDYRFNPRLKIVNSAPDGGLFSNPGELVKFIQMFLENDGKVLSRSSVAEMLKEQAPGRGLGWALGKDRVFSHGGSSGTYAWGEPNTGVVGILFLQYWGSDRVGKLREGFVKAVREGLRD